MKNSNKTQYSVVGSAALRNEPVGLIIEFPLPGPVEPLHAVKPVTPLRGNVSKVISRAMSPIVHWYRGVLQGSLKGKPVNKNTRWESVLGSMCIFAVAIACIYFGA